MRSSTTTVLAVTVQKLGTYIARTFWLCQCFQPDGTWINLSQVGLFARLYVCWSLLVLLLVRMTHPLSAACQVVSSFLRWTNRACMSLLVLVGPFASQDDPSFVSSLLRTMATDVQGLTRLIRDNSVIAFPKFLIQFSALLSTSNYFRTVLVKCSHRYYTRQSRDVGFK